MEHNLKRGFTLIELLVVIAIIGLLATVVLINVSGVMAKARDVKRIQDIQSLSKALLLYNIDHGEYPPNHSVLNSSGICTWTLGNKWSNADCLSELVTGGYIRARPTPSPHRDDNGTDASVTYSVYMYHNYYNSASDHPVVSIRAVLETETGASPCNFEKDRWCDLNMPAPTNNDQHYCLCFE